MRGVSLILPCAAAVGGFVWAGVEDWSGGLELEYGAMGLWGYGADGLVGMSWVG